MGGVFFSEKRIFQSETIIHIESSFQNEHNPSIQFMRQTSLQRPATNDCVVNGRKGRLIHVMDIPGAAGATAPHQTIEKLLSG